MQVNLQFVVAFLGVPDLTAEVAVRVTDKLGETYQITLILMMIATAHLLLQPMILIQILATVWTMLTMVLMMKPVVGPTGLQLHLIIQKFQ